MNQLTKSMKEKENTWISYFKREREENNETVGLFWFIYRQRLVAE